MENSENVEGNTELSNREKQIIMLDMVDNLGICVDSVKRFKESSKDSGKGLEDSLNSINDHELISKSAILKSLVDDDSRLIAALNEVSLETPYSQDELREKINSETTNEEKIQFLEAVSTWFDRNIASLMELPPQLNSVRGTVEAEMDAETSTPEALRTVEREFSIFLDNLSSNTKNFTGYLGDMHRVWNDKLNQIR